jgi:hypothetical protein
MSMHVYDSLDHFRPMLDMIVMKFGCLLDQRSFIFIQLEHEAAVRVP